jgi:hypothetical protein
MTLGGQRSELTAQFVRLGLWLTAIGVACGLVVAFVTMRLIVVNPVPCEPCRSDRLYHHHRRRRGHRISGLLSALAPRYDGEPRERLAVRVERLISEWSQRASSRRPI